MDRTKLFPKWILPLVTLFLIYMAIDSKIDSNLELKDLVQVEGSIRNYEYYEIRSKHSTYLHMRIFLNNGMDYTVTSKWDQKFKDIENALTKSRYAEFYYRHLSQTKWRRGRSNIIYQLKIGDTMIFDINDSQNELISLSVFFGCSSILVIIAMIIRKYYETDPENRFRKRFDNWIDKIFRLYSKI